MREIVHLQVGQCGNQMSSKFWSMVAAEHGVLPSGLQSQDASDLELARVQVYFDEVNGERYVPRAVLIDLEPSVLDSIRGSDIGSMFNPDSFLFSQNGAGNNWAKGFYTEGSELLDPVLDVTRKAVESCDCLQGFQLAHSLGGGSGAGLGALIQSKLKEEFSDRIQASFSVFPSANVSDTVTEPYNSILCINQLIENADEVITIDNEALYSICTRTLGIPAPTYADLNQILAAGITGVTAGLRFPGQLNSNLRKLAVNLVPFPRLHFLTMSFAPLASRASQAFESVSVTHVTEQLFDPRFSFCAADPRHGRYLTAAAMFRGDATAQEVDESVGRFTKPSGHFVPFLPSVVTTSICSVPPLGLKLSATGLTNTTSISAVFERIEKQFMAMHGRKAFMHWYLGEGMDEGEFVEAESNVKDLVAEMQQYQEQTGETTWEEVED